MHGPQERARTAWCSKRGCGVCFWAGGGSVPAAAAQRMRELHLAAENVELVMTQIYKSDP
jgi:hypothetical protein